MVGYFLEGEKAYYERFKAPGAVFFDGLVSQLESLGVQVPFGDLRLPSDESPASSIDADVLAKEQLEPVSSQSIDYNIELNCDENHDEKADSIISSTNINKFNETFYLRRYPDVAEGVKNGAFASGYQHYRMYGMKERRAASENVDAGVQASPQGALPLAMTPAEQGLLVSFLRCSQHYLEFGSGGSTVAAAAHVGQSVVSVDSSDVWQAKVAQSCVAVGARIAPTLIHVNIGPTRDWGYPLDETHKALWPDYVSTVWEYAEARASDLCLIDGRFRVASFISVLLHCSPLVTIMFHDFPERTPYHVVRQFADEIASNGSLTVFRPSAGFDRETALATLEAFKFDPA
jgi:hypothetical protein